MWQVMPFLKITNLDIYGKSKWTCYCRSWLYRLIWNFKCLQRKDQPGHRDTEGEKKKREREANRESEKMTGRQTKRVTNKRKETSEVDGLWSKPRKMLLPFSVWRPSRGSSTASLMFLCDQTADRRAQVAVIAGPNISLVVFLPHQAAGAERGPVVWRAEGALALGQGGCRIFSAVTVISNLAIWWCHLFVQTVYSFRKKSKKKKRINKTPNKCWQLLMACCAKTRGCFYILINTIQVVYPSNFIAIR